MVKTISFSVISLLLLWCNVLVLAQNIDASSLNQYFQTLESNDRFMGSVSVFHDGLEIYAKSVGFVDLDNGVRANGKTKYSIGSISKTFTAVMVFQAIEAGRLSLSETIDAYFPSIGNAKEITISHLLSHRSGIHNFTADEQYSSWQVQPKTREEMVEIIAEGGTDFEPDSKTQYSNSNYVLLSYVLESVYGKPYAEILVDHITKPLSLDDTRLDIVTQRNECNSYKYFDKWRIEQHTNPTIALGAGGIISTPNDLNRFAVALFSGKLISASSLSIMQTIKDGYGMGLFPVPFYSKRGYGHSGGVDGFHSMLIYIPEDKISYAITSNALNYTFNDIHIAVLSCLYGMPFEIPSFQAVNLTPKDLDRYLGVYSSNQLPIKLTIRKNGNSLEGQGTGQSAFPLEPASEHIFKFTQGGIVMEFNPAEDTMILKQGGGVFYFKKE